MRHALWSLVLILILVPGTVAAEMALSDPREEARATAIGEEIRCVVCQSESIDDSQADMARDMRQLVREKVHAGWSDRQVVDYLRERYGDFILLRPPVQSNTWLLWFAPLGFLLSAGAATVVLMYRGLRLGTKPPPLAPVRGRRPLATLKRRVRKRVR